MVPVREHLVRGRYLEVLLQRRLPVVLPHGDDVPKTGAHMQLEIQLAHALLEPGMRFQPRHQLIAVRAAYLAARMGEHVCVAQLHAGRDGNEVAPQGGMPGREVDAHAGGFERRSPRVLLFYVISHYPNECSIRSRCHTPGYGQYGPQFSGAGQTVGVGRYGRLDGRLIAQLGYRPVGHAVAHN